MIAIFKTNATRHSEKEVEMGWTIAFLELRHTAFVSLTSSKIHFTFPWYGEN
jgi:hypothetical protein